MTCTAIALLLLASTTQGQTWIHSPVNGHWYSAVYGTTLGQAQSVAQSYGGDVVTIRSSQENSWIRSTFGNGAPIKIGLHTLDFTWISGEPVAFTNWATGQPNSSITYTQGYMYNHNGLWYNQTDGTNAAIPTVLEIESADCDQNGSPDTVQILQNPQLDMDGNFVLDQCEDCNLNGIPDGLDIQNGSEVDCDGDGQPDSCQLLTSPELDCNQSGVLDTCEVNANSDCDANGALDSCEIASRPSLDFDRNGVLDTCQCFTTNYCLAVGNSAGTQAVMRSQGPISLAQDSFALAVDGAPAFKPGIFFYGMNQGQALVGEGVLCIAPDIQRLQPILLTDAQGSASMALDLQSPPFSTGPFAINPLTTWNFQFWYRDPLGGPAGFNFSDGLEVTFCP